MPSLVSWSFGLAHTLVCLKIYSSMTTGQKIAPVDGQVLFVNEALINCQDDNS